MSIRAAAWLGWSVCAASLSLLSLALLLIFLGWSTPLPPGWYPWQGQAIVAATLVGAPVLGTRSTPFGVLYEVVVLVDGLSGATAPVAAIWIIEGDLPPRLVSTWVDIP